MNRIIEEDIETILTTPYLNFDRFRNKTILVTGAYGMLASYLVWPLIAKNRQDNTFSCKIFAQGRNKDKMRARFKDAPDEPWFRMIEGDVSKLPDINEKVDFIIHAASPVNPRSYLTNPDAVRNANVKATKKLLVLAQKNKSEGLLFISSGEVYGTVHKEEVREEDMGELDPGNPRNIYALSKREGEKLCVLYAKENGVHARIARPSHTYGPTMNLAGDGRVFSEFVSDAVAGRDIRVKSGGGTARAFIYLTDAAAGYYKILLDGQDGEAYNVSNTHGVRSIKELAEYIASLSLEGRSRVVFEKPDELYRENPNAIPTLRNTEKLQSLGWKARISPEEGFARTVSSFLSVYG